MNFSEMELLVEVNYENWQRLRLICRRCWLADKQPCRRFSIIAQSEPFLSENIMDEPSDNCLYTYKTCTFRNCFITYYLSQKCTEKTED